MNQTLNQLLILLLFLFSFQTIQAQQKFIHPRGLLNAEELTTLRQKVERQPWKDMTMAMRNSAVKMTGAKTKTNQDSSAVARIYAYLYTLSGEKADAETAWKYAEGVLNNPDIFNNPVSRGLTRARLLRDMAETYDLCFNAWSDSQQRMASEKLLYATMTTSSNMGYDANYAIESNWMGVRYGAVLLAALVNDDWNANDKVRSRLLPFEWDANKRLGEHIAVNINPNGWNTESLSYFSYNWTFVAPALIAVQNRIGAERYSIEQNVPNAVNSFWAYSTATVAIPGINNKVMQPDFSDDDPMSSYFLFPIGLRLSPETQKPALLWMLNYLSSPDTWQNDGEQLFYNILWTPENIQPENPAKSGWLTYFDADQGMALFRNRFQDETDIVAGFTATAKRVRGHQGFDNLGFRILGLGSIWAVGAGRTGQVAGHTCLFPITDIANHSGEKGAVGKVLQTHFDDDGSGWMTATGSCLGVASHVRTFHADYSKKSGAEAVFIIIDRSENGKIWRMNSPEFNELTINPDGFTLISPDGARLKAVVFTDSPKLKVTSSKIQYGGDTKDHNRGIAFHGKSYAWTNAIDCTTNGNITVVLTLQPKGKEHPQVIRNIENQITVGGIALNFKENKFTLMKSTYWFINVVFVLLLGFSSCQQKDRKIQAVSSLSIESAPWGVEFNALPPHIDKYPHELNDITFDRIDSLVESASSLGVKWVRLSVNWSNVVDTAGNYHWSKVDQIVNGLYHKKINIALCINGGHKRYTNSKAPVTPEEIQHWRQFAKTLVGRYREKVEHWELWNEPNTVWFWKPYPNATHYVNLMKEFHTIIKAIDPEGKIVGGSLARLDMVFADSLFKQGFGNYIDAFTYHPYNEIPEATIQSVRVSVKTPLWYTESDHSVFRLKELIDSVNPAIRVWQGECGYPSQDNSSGWMGNGPWSPTIQAKWLLRRMLVDLSYNADVINYFSMVEYTTGGNVDEGKGKLNSKGLLQLEKLTTKPAYYAYQNLISVLNGPLKAALSTHYSIKINNEGSFYGVRSKNIKFLDIDNGTGARLLAYWIVWKMQDRTTDASISLTTEKPFIKPVLINLLTGKVNKIHFENDGIEQHLLNVPLGDYPFIITEEENIKTI